MVLLFRSSLLNCGWDNTPYRPLRTTRCFETNPHSHLPIIRTFIPTSYLLYRAKFQLSSTDRAWFNWHVLYAWYEIIAAKLACLCTIYPLPATAQINRNRIRRVRKLFSDASILDRYIDRSIKNMSSGLHRCPFFHRWNNTRNKNNLDLHFLTFHSNPCTSVKILLFMKLTILRILSSLLHFEISLSS